MKYLKVRHYAKVLFKEGTAWEYKDILEARGLETTPSQIKRLSLIKRSLLALVSVVFCIFLNKGFNQEYVGYVAAALSIFIGLFTNIIIVLYQRYSSIPIVTDTTPDTERLSIIKNKNFIKQFTFVTGKNILVATLLIILLTFTLLYKEFFLTDTSKFAAIKSGHELNLRTIYNFLVVSFLFSYRVLAIYLLIDFFLLLLYSLGALFAFLKSEYSK